MKNTIKLLAIIALIAIIGFSMAACDTGNGPGDTHTHTWSTTWSYNATQHWYECTANDGAKKDLANHSDDPCSVCDYSSSNTSVTFSSVTANGNATTTTTTLTLTFSAAVTGLSATDINLSGVAGVQAGSLSGSGPTYTLGISGFTANGSLSVAVSKSGYNIMGSPKTTTIYYYSGTTPGSGQYSGKDVLGNSYSLAVGSDNSRAAKKNDRYSMEVKTRDGKTRWVAGTVTDISADGTLTLEPDGNGNDAFTANVDGDDLNSVAGSGDDIAQIPLTDGTTTTTITPRTFDEVYLRATRWSNATASGEHWGSGKSVLVRDFPTNVSNLVKGTSDRYSITISGTSNVALQYGNIEVQGLTEGDEWIWLTGADLSAITANVPFSQTVMLNIGDDANVSYNLMDYKEIILQVTNVMNTSFINNPEWDKNNGTIPDEIPDGQIMAVISGFKIVLKDAQKEALAGNMSDYHYGYQEDGLSIAYQQAVWSLSAANIAAAKQAGAKFEFIMLDVDDIEEAAPTLAFIWQDPVRGLWWQDMTTISGGDEADNWAYKQFNGTVWNASRKKMTVDLSQVIKDNQFAASTELNFIIACWWRSDGEGERINIDEFGIGGANIFVSPSPTTGNMGNYSYGYQEDGISIEYKQAVWHLPAATFTTAKGTNAKLELVFNRDLTEYSPALYLVWQDNATQRWWPTDAEAGTNNANLLIINYDNGAYAGRKTGVTYDSGTKKLTIVLNNSLETYSSFSSATDVNLVLICWYGITDSINELGIVSANIVTTP